MNVIIIRLQEYVTTDKNKYAHLYGRVSRGDGIKIEKYSFKIFKVHQNANL